MNFCFKILWDQICKNSCSGPQLDLVATDLETAYLHKANAGIYGPGSLREVPPVVMQNYFEKMKSGEKFQVRSFLKEGVIWKTHNFLEGFLHSHFHLIFLRNNLLTYYEDELKVPAFRKIVSCLRTGGLIIIGSHEKMPLGGGLFRPYNGLSCIFTPILKG
ncbi:MAG: hypothetical protein JRJ85_14370 [Deltaproteobacteria bacterium]|nr:hypothetical protein [Deltaproteobacteria bacterium]